MKTLTWAHLRKFGSFDNANRYYPDHPALKAYIAEGGYRSPSRAWPWSYAKPLLTQKCMKWLIANHPEFVAGLNK